jgi:hypothetical protein
MASTSPVALGLTSTLRAQVPPVCRVSVSVAEAHAPAKNLRIAFTLQM